MVQELQSHPWGASGGQGAASAPALTCMILHTPPALAHRHTFAHTPPPLLGLPASDIRGIAFTCQDSAQRLPSRHLRSGPHLSHPLLSSVFAVRTLPPHRRLPPGQSVPIRILSSCSFLLPPAILVPCQGLEKD